MQAPSKDQPDSLASRIQNTANALGIQPEWVASKLKEFGIEDNDLGLSMLDDDEVTKFGDFVNLFGKLPVESGGWSDAPMARLRMAYKFLKGSKKTDERTGVDPRLVELKELGYKVKLDDADNATLLSKYRPDLPSDPVTVVLKKRFGDKKVISFKQDGSIALEEVLAYLSDLEQGFDPQESIQVDGRLEPLYPIGSNPKKDELVEEDPLFEGKALRQGRSQVNHRNWSKVKFEDRQFVRIIVRAGLVDVNDREAVLRLVERAEAGAEKLAEAYPEADLEFRRLKKDDDLPKLKVRLGSFKQNNPFGVNRRY